MNYKHISHDERVLIVDDYNFGLSISQIARKRNRNKSTVSRLLKVCNDTKYVQDGSFWKKVKYFHAERGEIIYKLNRKRCRKKCKLKNNKPWLNYIKIMLIEYKSSPYDMIMKLDDKVFDLNTGKFHNQTYREFYKLDNVSVCEKTIYNAIHNHEIDEIKPYMMLMCYKKGKQYVFKEGKRINGDCIDKMSKELLERDLNCVWEGDTVVGKQGTKQCVLTLTNRKNNDEIIIKLLNRTKTSVVNAFDWLEQSLGYEKFHNIFSYIIFDNGIEFRNVSGIENSCLLPNARRTKIYFAHPYRSCERPINENNNRMIRKWIPKSIDMAKFTVKQIWIVNTLINLTHRKRLNGMCSNPSGGIIPMSI